METVRLDDGLLRTTRRRTGSSSSPSSCPASARRPPGSASAPPARTSAASRWASPTCSSTWCSRAPSAAPPRQLALELEVRGGSLDAFTGRDHTSYQAHMLDADLPLAVEILTDLVRRPLLRESDLELERNVILEEINGVEDTPDDLVFELHAADALARSTPTATRSSARPTPSAALSADDLRCLHQTGYYRGNCVVAAAGNVEPRPAADGARARGLVRGHRAGAGPRGRWRPRRRVRGAERREERDTAQTHIVFGTDTFPLRDPRRFALAILTNVFGGGMSSRLFQRVREELGLAYAIFAYKHFYQSAGQLGVYVGTQPGTADQAVEAIRGGVRPAGARGAARRRAGRRQAAAQGPGHAVAREPRRADGPAGRLRAARRRVSPARPDAGRDRRGHARTRSRRWRRSSSRPSGRRSCGSGPEQR